MDKKVPEIRFKEFSGEWVTVESCNIFQTYYEKNHPDLPVLSASQEHGMVIRDNVGFQVQHNKDNETDYKRVLPGQFVIHLRSFQGGFAHSNVEGITSPAYTVIEFRDKENHNDIYWKFVLTSNEFIKRLETVTYGIRDGRSISFVDFSELDFNVPNVDEQAKIGKLFTTIDRLIDKLEQKLEKLRKIKQALLNQMFINVNRGGCETPILRFARYKEPWLMKQLNEYLSVSEETNQNNLYNKHSIFSVSKRFGVINQIAYQGKSFAGTSLKNYRIVHNKNVVYTKSPLKEQPYGIIKSNINEDGIVSPLYAVYRTREEVVSEFVQTYFELDSRLNDYLQCLVNKGAKNTLLVSDEDALKGIVVFPKKDEQSQITGLFSVLGSVMDEQENRIAKLRQTKQSLLRKMFV